MQIDTRVLSQFPKHRPELPPRYRAIYVEHYRRNRGGASPATSAARRMESWMHRKVAADTTTRSPGYSTLEIGAGTLNHLDYEPDSTPYDIIEPLVELYAGSLSCSRIRDAYADLRDISNGSYDRIISVAAFEHVCELPAIVARCGLLLNDEGELRVAIPSEGTILWALGWKLTTGIEFRLQHGLNYGVLMRHEHVNTAAEIASVLRIFFRYVRRSVFGVAPFLSFYQFFECRDPDLRRCTDYLSDFDLTT